MEYFVYYDDDFYDCGGVGFEEFEKYDDALEFITNRMKDKGEDTCLCNYILIYGNALTLVEEKVVTKIGTE